FSGDMSGVSNLTSLTNLYLIGDFTINYTQTNWANDFQYYLFRPITSTNSLDSQELDQLLIDFSNTSWSGSKSLYADGNNGVRTSASDQAVADLQAMGVTLYLNT